MNKLPKEIYVEEGREEDGVFFINPEDCALTDKTVTLAVYKLAGKVEVSTQIKQEIVVKKSPKKAAVKPSEPVTEPITSPLIEQMRVTS
jgi:hypothetical protein